MPSLRLASLALVAIVAACGGKDPNPAVDAGPATDAPPPPTDAWVLPVFRNPVNLPNATLAQQAAALLGVTGDKNCNGCHSLTRSRLELWNILTDGGEQKCLTNLAPATEAAAMEIVECLRDKADHKWHPGVLGVYSTAAGLPWFEYVFHLAYGAGWAAPFDEWKGRVEMPRGAHPRFTQAQFDIVAEWFARDLPELETVVPPDPPPPPCNNEITPAIAAHVNAMSTGGWRALNQAAGILMYGCQGAASPRDCLTSHPLSTSQTWAAGWNGAAPATKIRLLREITYQSSFWTRSSADGRFVSHGGSSSSAGSTVIDLAQNREIPADAYYDPGFFPDNSGFIIQGSGAHFCRQSLLTSSPTRITFNEPACNDVNGVGLYQHLGAVHGGDYWTVNGYFASDNGQPGDPPADFSSDSEQRLTPMIHDGTRYVARAGINVPTPHEADTVIAPSSKLLISRIGNAQGQIAGFVVRRVIATPAGNSYNVQVPIAARYCVRGGKPALSFDERWLVYHHYVEAGDWQSLGYPSASDPAFTALVQAGAANLFVLDLLTGEERRITTMGPGQLALFPHFRSDGWIYAIVKDLNRNREVVIASDAALVFAQP